MSSLPPAPNEPLSGISEQARYWIRVQYHVYPLLDAGRINLPDAAERAGVELADLLHNYRVFCINRKT